MRFRYERDPATFWARVDRRGPDDCWEWTRCRGAEGYGRVNGGSGAKGKIYNAHRVAYALTHPRWDGTKKVLHRCDNPPCCNPRHLFLGTDADNMRDKAAKGRVKPVNGSLNPNAKLTEAQVRKILTSRHVYRQLADEYGVTIGMIGHIKKGRSWRHLS
jgi:hypothetical protein